MPSQGEGPLSRDATGGRRVSDAAIETLIGRNHELEAEVARLGEAVEARDALLAMAGHELRNPMTPILGRVQMLRHLVEKPSSDLTRIGKALGDIEWLIGQYIKRATILLQVARLNGGRLQLGQVRVDVVGLVAQVVENFRPVADQSGSKLTLILPSHALIVLGDALALEQIVDNLVSNAIKYGEGKAVAIEVSAESKAGQVSVRVVDQGAGIPAADHARIFERFERAMIGREQKSGFGVGLWIARQLAEAMGGRISLTSEAGAGSSFCLSLPACAPEDSK